MKAILYRTFHWDIEIPNKKSFRKPNSDRLDAEKVRDWLDANDAWPSLLDGEEHLFESEVILAEEA